jgi:hypothetical protein
MPPLHTFVFELIDFVGLVWEVLALLWRGLFFVGTAASLRTRLPRSAPYASDQDVLRRFTLAVALLPDPVPDRSNSRRRKGKPCVTFITSIGIAG